MIKNSLKQRPSDECILATLGAAAREKERGKENVPTLHSREITAD